MHLPSIEPAFAVDVRRDLSQEAFAEEYVAARRPVVLAGAMARSPALDWTIDSITSIAPARKAPAIFFPKGDPYERKTLTKRDIELAELGRVLRSPRDEDDPYPYLVCELARHFPELVHDARLAYAPDPERSLAFELLAGRDTTTGTHQHIGTHALVTQLRGKKRLILHPPEERRFLYPYPIHDLHYSCTRARFDRPEQYPLLARARATQVDLSPGDTLLVPTGWWHAAFAEGESITLSYFWMARGAAQHLLRYVPRLHRALWDLIH
jgi:lysine-specific demethylase 8